MATIHGRLGCVGAITNGCVRDLDEARSLGFHFFASGVCVSHAYVHQIDHGTPVEIGGVTVRDGDLLHADKHGVLVVPIEIAREIPAAAARQIEEEKVLLNLCKAPDFTIEALRDAFES
jgi:4-hydroxy-4-methyl-2-oxoglutarate aldolase